MAGLVADAIRPLRHGPEQSAVPPDAGRTILNMNEALFRFLAKSALYFLWFHHQVLQLSR